MKLYINSSSREKVTVGINGIMNEAQGSDRKSQPLLPLITNSLHAVDRNFEDITEVEVDLGPGSFTGLRVGVAIAQAIAWGLKIKANDTDFTKAEFLHIKY